ncbi:MAG: DUF523 domain-containing protein [Acidobacteria bacterium]|nr:DUF523 domain-containing protein [Acidobacteriota bacterium]
MEDKTAKPCLIVSACLMGYKVRYDCLDKKNDYIINELSKRFELIPVCPEFESGMGTPREKIKLYQYEGEIKVVGTESRTDYTDTIKEFSRKKLKEISEKWKITGAILKSKSPSCGIRNVPVHNLNGDILYIDKGLFVFILSSEYPDLPVIDDQEIEDQKKLEAFLNRVNK